MAERRLQGLQRVLGVNALFSTAYGNVGSSIYYALGLVASFALGLTPVVFLIAGVVFVLTAATYAEGTSMFPEAGGSSSFARRAFNELWSFVAAWGQMLNYTITIAISAFFVPHYLGGLVWEPLRHGPADVIFAIALIAVLALVNVRGVREAARVNVVLAVVDLLTQLLLVAAGLVLVFSPQTLVDNVHLGVAPSWEDFLLAIPVGMIAYTGIETISNMAEEARDERRTIPAAIRRVVIAVVVIYATLPLVALSALPVERTADGAYRTLLGVGQEDGGYAGDPVLGVVRHLELGPLQHAAEAYVALLAATILLIAANAGILGVSRLVYSMGIHRQVPDGLRRLHPRHGTPWVGILVFAAVACLAVIPGEAAFLGNVYAFGAMLSFTIAHVAVIRLRRTMPDAPRPYRGPGRIGSLPLFAVLGGLGTGLAFVTVTVMHVEVAAAGVGWLLLGVGVYVAYRRRQGLDLTSTKRVAVPHPVVDHEAEYDSILVAFDGLRYDETAIGTAARLASRRRRGIHVLVTIPVPSSSPIDAALPDQEARARELIERARLQAGRRVTGHAVRVRAGQAGRVIVKEATAMRARAIVMGLSGRGGATLYSRTVETVLANRPCRVIIAAAPGSAGRVDQLQAAALLG
mgnify:CR=1 FL=1